MVKPRRFAEWKYMVEMLCDKCHVAYFNHLIEQSDMDYISSCPLSNCKRLKTLAFHAQYSHGNNLLHQFVVDNSDPNVSGSASYINAVLLSMTDFPANAVNALNDEGYSALHLAVLKNNLLMVKKLLSCLRNIHVNTRCKVANVNMRNGVASPPYYAAQSGNFATVESLVSPRGRCFVCRERKGNTALHLAVQLNYLSITQELLNKGADVSIKNSDGNTLLCIASKSDDLNMMKLLVSKGAEVNMRNGAPSPLHYAVQSGNFAAVEFLVSHGANVYAEDYCEMTPLHYAAISGNLEIVEFLVSRGADVNAAKSKKMTHLDLYLDFLVSRDADVNAAKNKRMTLSPLHYAVKSGNLEIVELLVSKGADVNAVEYFKRTPLHNAVKYGDLATVEFLISNGANVNDRDLYKMTPLHYAVESDNLAVVKCLVSNGADVNAKGISDTTPIFPATLCRSHHSAIVEFLISNGANAEDINWHNWWTPLYYAVKKWLCSHFKMFSKQ